MMGYIFYSSGARKHTHYIDTVGEAGRIIIREALREGMHGVLSTRRVKVLTWASGDPGARVDCKHVQNKFTKPNWKHRARRRLLPRAGRNRGHSRAGATRK